MGTLLARVCSRDGASGCMELYPDSCGRHPYDSSHPLSRCECDHVAVYNGKNHVLQIPITGTHRGNRQRGGRAPRNESQANPQGFVRKESFPPRGSGTRTPLVWKTCGNGSTGRRGRCEVFVAGIDGCRGGWVSFRVDLASLNTSVELIDLPHILRNKPNDVAILGIDIPVGLLIQRSASGHSPGNAQWRMGRGRKLV